MSRLARHYALLELPAWGHVLRWTGAFDADAWRQAPREIVRGKWHGYLMSLDLRNWSERQTYFLGRFYDLPTQLVMRHALCPGDVFVDIGANIGMMTLLGARLVGPRGHVHAFEPNPQALERLNGSVAMNGLKTSVSVHPVALSDAPGRLTLSVVTEHTGMGTLADIPPDQQALVSRRHEVAVSTGDDQLADCPRLDAIKVDVEGFECQVFDGMQRTLSRHRPWIVAEVVREHLERAGTSEARLFELLGSLGYEPFALHTQRHGMRHRLRLLPIDPARPQHRQNVLFMHPDQRVRTRLARFID